MNPDDQIASIFKNPDLDMIIELAIILLVAGVLAHLLRRLLPWVASRLHGEKRLHLLASVPLLRLFIILTTITLIVPRLIKPSVQNMVALLGTVGLALGFAFKDYVSSLIAGIVAIGEHPYRNGDWIKIDGVYGEVRHVGLRAVEVVTPDDTVVVIPHGRLWTEPVHNANDGGPRLMCVADFHLHPEHDAAQARQVLWDVALTSPYLHFSTPVAVIVHERPWGTHYRLKAYPVASGQQFRFITDLTVRGKAALQAMGARFVMAPPVPGGQE
ncbi:MAG: mechanosensitive ion channel [Desulfobulbus sp.]|jgi:small-conductance mechanosensitive channel|nr:mechanosensitive ion channel [Desulfobulbus sp.]